jgi:hypothetical protein
VGFALVAESDGVRASVTPPARLAASVIEQNDEWLAGRCYLSDHSLEHSSPAEAPIKERQ